ncbi:ABC transporter substrate-binding protein [Sutcliffiella sp. NPDC057660]|uniref:ABC transporter substrate-binding protein n=1 Tax=Sutcliffiella sp. NPDC057660 TaxID=3346199 RepID=UPI00368646E3
MKQLWKKWSIITLIMTMAILAGCGVNGTDTNKQSSGEVNESAANEVQGTEGKQFPVTIKDETGEEIVIEAEPESIISLQASSTEISYALGLGDKMVGVSDYCNYPQEALEIEKVGAQDMNVERILTLLPDIALVTDYHLETHAEILSQFEEAGITVIVIGSETSFDDVYETIDLIGTATGKKAEAKELVSDMKERLETVKEKAKSVTDKKKVWVEVSPAPDIFTTGQGTFMHEMLESIQAENAAGDQEGWVKMTEEEIVQLNPDVIVTTYGYYVESPKETVMARNGWAEVPAIKSGEVHDVDSDMVTRPGPRLIEGVETLAKIVYPEIFN